jgi:hypothetical protein
MFSLSSLMSLLDKKFDMLEEDELALLTRWLERMHENRVNTRRNTRTYFQCSKLGHFVADCPRRLRTRTTTSTSRRRMARTDQGVTTSTTRRTSTRRTKTNGGAEKEEGAEKNECKENQRRCCIRQDKGREAACKDQKND